MIKVGDRDCTFGLSRALYTSLARDSAWGDMSRVSPAAAKSAIAMQKKFAFNIANEIASAVNDEFKSASNAGSIANSIIQSAGLGNYIDAQALFTQPGSLIYSSGPGVPKELLGGSNGDYLQFLGGKPAWGPAPASSGSSSSSTSSLAPGLSLAMHPTTADPRDEEFEGATPYAGWTITGSGGSSTRLDDPDPYASFNTADSRRDSWNSYRPGWFIVQPSYDRHQTIMYKTVTINTNDLIWIRYRADFRPGSADGDAGVMFGLVDNVSTFANFILYGANYFASEKLLVANTAGGNLGPTAIPNSSDMAVMEYLALQKIGTTYHAWYGGISGWRYLGSTTNSASMPVVIVGFSNSGAPTPGNPLVGIDFVRFIASATVLP